MSTIEEPVSVSVSDKPIPSPIDTISSNLPTPDPSSIGSSARKKKKSKNRSNDPASPTSPSDEVTEFEENGDNDELQSTTLGPDGSLPPTPMSASSILPLTEDNELSATTASVLDDTSVVKATEEESVLHLKPEDSTTEAQDIRSPTEFTSDSAVNEDSASIQSKIEDMEGESLEILPQEHPPGDDITSWVTPENLSDLPATEPGSNELEQYPDIAPEPNQVTDLEINLSSTNTPVKDITFLAEAELPKDKMEDTPLDTQNPLGLEITEASQHKLETEASTMSEAAESISLNETDEIKRQVHSVKPALESFEETRNISLEPDASPSTKFLEATKVAVDLKMCEEHTPMRQEKTEMALGSTIDSPDSSSRDSVEDTSSPVVGDTDMAENGFGIESTSFTDPSGLESVNVHTPNHKSDSSNYEDQNNENVEINEIQTEYETVHSPDIESLHVVNDDPEPATSKETSPSLTSHNIQEAVTSPEPQESSLSETTITSDINCESDLTTADQADLERKDFKLAPEEEAIEGQDALDDEAKNDTYTVPDSLQEIPTAGLDKVDSSLEKSPRSCDNSIAEDNVSEAEITVAERNSIQTIEKVHEHPESNISVELPTEISYSEEPVSKNTNTETYPDLSDEPQNSHIEEIEEELDQELEFDLRQLAEVPCDEVKNSQELDKREKNNLGNDSFSIEEARMENLPHEDPQTSDLMAVGKLEEEPKKMSENSVNNELHSNLEYSNSENSVVKGVDESSEVLESITSKTSDKDMPMASNEEVPGTLESLNAEQLFEGNANDDEESPESMASNKLDHEATQGPEVMTVQKTGDEIQEVSESLIADQLSNQNLEKASVTTELDNEVPEASNEDAQEKSALSSAEHLNEEMVDDDMSEAPETLNTNKLEIDATEDSKLLTVQKAGVGEQEFLESSNEEQPNTKTMENVNMDAPGTSEFSSAEQPVVRKINDEVPDASELLTAEQPVSENLGRAPEDLKLTTSEEMDNEVFGTSDSLTADQSAEKKYDEVPQGLELLTKEPPFAEILGNQVPEGSRPLIEENNVSGIDIQVATAEEKLDKTIPDISVLETLEILPATVPDFAEAISYPSAKSNGMVMSSDIQDKVTKDSADESTTSLPDFNFEQNPLQIQIGQPVSESFNISSTNDHVSVDYDSYQGNNDNVALTRSEEQRKSDTKIDEIEDIVAEMADVAQDLDHSKNFPIATSPIQMLPTEGQGIYNAQFEEVADTVAVVAQELDTPDIIVDAAMSTQNATSNAEPLSSSTNQSKESVAIESGSPDVNDINHILFSQIPIVESMTEPTNEGEYLLGENSNAVPPLEHTVTENVDKSTAHRSADEEIITEPAPQSGPSEVHGIFVTEDVVPEILGKTSTSEAVAPIVVVSSADEQTDRSVEIVEPTPSENTPGGIRKRQVAQDRPTTAGSDIVSTRRHNRSILNTFWHVFFFGWLGGMGRFFGGMFRSRKKETKTSRTTS